MPQGDYDLVADLLGPDGRVDAPPGSRGRIHLSIAP